MSDIFFSTAEEAIVDLSLTLDPSYLLGFFDAYPEFNYLLKDTYYLELLSEKYKVPTASNI